MTFSPLSEVPMRPGQRTPLQLVAAMCKRLGYRVSEVRGASRERRFAMVRAEIVESLRLCGFSFPVIGRAINRDHATVQYLLGMCRRQPSWSRKDFPESQTPNPPVGGRETMGQLGIGVMISRLSGNEKSVEAVLASVGKEIVSVECVDNALRMHFTDGTGISLADDGQSCCESRYMKCDDDLAYFAGHKIVDYEQAAGPNAEGEHGDVHEIEFLRVKTDKGVISVANHVEHNGYYGGFSIRARAL